MDKFKTFVKNAFKAKEASFTIVEQFSLPKDFAVHKNFKEGNYLKVLFIQKKKTESK